MVRDRVTLKVYSNLNKRMLDFTVASLLPWWQKAAQICARRNLDGTQTEGDEFRQHASCQPGLGIIGQSRYFTHTHTRGGLIRARWRSIVCRSQRHESRHRLCLSKVNQCWHVNEESTRHSQRETQTPLGQQILLKNTHAHTLPARAEHCNKNNINNRHDVDVSATPRNDELIH